MVVEVCKFFTIPSDERRMKMQGNLGETIIQASIYIYFIAFSAGMGLLTVVAIGFKMYKRSLNKGERKKKFKRGAAA